MQNLGLFRYLQPSFFSGLLDDPVLFINVRPTGRGILIDCGQLHHLAKRVLRSIDAIFVSHAHMDHLMGFDQVLRHVHVAPRTITVFGPPGIAGRIGHKLAGYDWNLTEESWCTVEVIEVHQERVEHFEFAGSLGFAPRHLQKLTRQSHIIYQNRHLQVEAELCDHNLPVLIFRVTEAPTFLLDRQRLHEERLLPGPWLKELKKRFYSDFRDTGRLEVWRDTGEEPATEEIDDAEALYHRICPEVQPASIGYLCDIGMTSDNLDRVIGLLRGVTLLVSECTFLAEDQAKGRISAHLCTTDLNRICREIRPELLLPMHLSKSYISDPQRLYDELDLPQSTRLLQLPDYMTPRPLLPGELPCPVPRPS
jgi:ribonuclease Z